jgi:c-di-AMP phosphodiesterase-like protein
VKRIRVFLPVLFLISFVSGADAGQSAQAKIKSYLDGYKIKLAREIAYSIGEESQRISDTMRIVALSGNFDIQIYNSYLLFRMENSNNPKGLSESSLLKKAHVRNREVLRKMVKAYYVQLSHENVLFYLKDFTKSNEHAEKYYKVQQVFFMSLLNASEESDDFLEFIKGMYELKSGRALKKPRN